MLKRPPKDQIDSKKSEEEIDKIVNKGAPVKEDVKQEEEKKGEKEIKEKWKLVPIRMPEKLLNELDEKIEKRIGMSRNAWILEAIQKSLKE